jgi:hypothetical protein
VAVLEIKATKRLERAGNVQRIREAGSIDNRCRSFEGVVMRDGMRVAPEGHEHIDSGLEERSHSTPPRGYRSQGASGSAIGVTVFDDLINEVLDLSREEGRATQSGKSSESFA